MKKSITYFNNQFSYEVYGLGLQTVICFHGYGMDASVFAPLAKDIGSDFTLLCIELPFHGECLWQEKRALETKDIAYVIDKAVAQEKLSGSFWLLGYSIGGRVAIDYFINYPERVTKVILLASDGLNNYFCYDLIAKTKFGFFLLKKLRKMTKWPIRCVDFFYKKKIINRPIYIMTKKVLDSSEERELFIKRWSSLRKIKPLLNRFLEILNHQKVKAYAVFGSRDKIIDITAFKYPNNENSENLIVLKIDAGHHLLKRPYFKEIAKLFYLK